MTEKKKKIRPMFNPTVTFSEEEWEEITCDTPDRRADEYVMQKSSKAEDWTKDTSKFDEIDRMVEEWITPSRKRRVDKNKD